MTTELDRLTEQVHYLVAWDGMALVQTAAGPRESRCRFEARIEVRGDHPRVRGIVATSFGLAAASVRARQGPTGVITVLGRSGGGSLTGARTKFGARLDLECEINYESLDRAHGIDVEATCYYLPALEPAAALLTGELVTAGREPALVNARVRVVSAAGRFEELQAIEISAERLRLIPLAAVLAKYRLGRAGEWAPLEDANTDGNICIQVNRRRLIIQPVGFRSSAADASPSGSTAATQLGEAQTVWTKSCVELQVKPMVVLTDATLKTSSDLTAIRNAYTDADPAVIEVFFVANSLPAVGGGSAGAIGVASCKPVIAEPNSGDPVLVAHELGHVLGLQHPGAGSNSDAGTVMAPTGSAMNPGTDLVTQFMCANISNPVLQTQATLCCLTHDIGNHYIRDFPVDIGNEPSEPIPAGMNRYAMSNVWNRLTNTAGTPSAATGPEHEQPVRYNADMTPRTNYLFALVEQTINLKVRNAVVKFFRKNPGSGGGAANLLFIGQTPVPDALAVGVPQTVSIPWTVPTGTPAHSCIFAVVRSDAEQEGDQSGLDWWQFEDLSRQDNDWAQRNLDIENFASSNVGDSNRVESAPALIYLPPRADRKAPNLVLEIDATKARGAAGLALELVGERSRAIKPGTRSRVTVKVERRREPLVLVLAAELAGGLETGRAFRIDVTPSLRGRAMIGFASEFRVTRVRDAIAQALDVSASAFLDLATFTDFRAADDLICSLREHASCPPLTLDRFVRDIVELEAPLEAARADLVRLPAARQTGAREIYAACLKAIELYKTGQTTGEEVATTYRSLCNRLQATAALLAAGA
jgi:hypothetical protein